MNPELTAKLDNLAQFIGEDAVLDLKAAIAAAAHTEYEQGWAKGLLEGAGLSANA
jgi:hypothetical protein